MALYNTVEDPLFDAKQVIEQVLEYKELNECRFYRDNRMNEKFIAVVKSLTGNLTDRDWGTNRYSNETIYLTEFGLYECFFASNKSTSQQFRYQVM